MEMLSFGVTSVSVCACVCVAGGGGSSNEGKVCERRLDESGVRSDR